MLFKKMTKLCAVMLCILLTLPVLSLSAGAVDEISTEEVSVITDTLRAVMEKNTEETTLVAIWLSDIDTEEALATNSMPDAQARLAYVQSVEANSTETNEIDRSIEVKRAALRYCYEAYTSDMGADYLTNDEIVYCSEYLPIVIADLSDERIEQLANVDAVASIDYYCDEIVEESETEMTAEGNTDASRSIVSGGETYYTVAENNSFVKTTDAWEEICNSVSSTGRSIRVGMIDAGIPCTSATAFDRVRSNIYIRRPGDTITHHATYDLEILTGIYIPNALYFCTTPLDTIGVAAELDWLLNRNVNLISISYNMADSTFNEYTAEDEIFDRVISLYDVTIITAAGNAMYDNWGVVGGAMAYNAITIGNYNRSTNSIHSTSSYYDYDGEDKLAQKPDLVAPGMFVLSAYACTNTNCESSVCGNGTCEYDGCCMGDCGILDTCCTVYRPNKSNGTSHSTPLVSCAVSALMWYQPTLKTKPALVKAILTASVSLTTNHHYDTSDTGFIQYGAGILNTLQAKKIIDNTTRFTMSSASSAGSVVNRSPQLIAGRVARVSFAFEKNSWMVEDNGSLGGDIFYTDSTLWDFYVRIVDPNGNPIWTFIVENNNLGIIEFTPTVSGYYTIKVSILADDEFTGEPQYIPYAFAVYQQEGV